MRATITGFRGSGVCSRAPKSPRTGAWSNSSSGPKSRALSSALRGIRPPCRPCGRNIRHTLYQPGKLPFSSPPRRATVSRSPTWPACPPTESYLIRSEKTRDKDLKERRDLDHQAHFFLPRPDPRRSMSSQGLYQHTQPPDRKFPDFSTCRLHRQLVQKMKARSGLHRVSPQHAVAVQKVGGGHRLLARELEDQEADGGSSGSHDQGVGVGFDDGAGRALVGALDGSRLVDDQT